jgi:imidazolonepropionase-like amidohydrolase
MTRKFAALGAAALLAAVTLNADAQGQNALVIRGATLIDGLGGAPVPNSVIVIQGNRIAAAGPAGRVNVPAGARVIEAAGKWVIPGLIDGKSNYYWEYGEAYLVWGVTSAMVSGARNDVGIFERDATNHGVFAGPRRFETMISIAGPGADGKAQDNFRPGMGTQIFHSPEEVRAAVAKYVAAGADFITFNDGNAPPEYYKLGAEEAHRLGKHVAFRAVGPITRAHGAAEIGADVLIHDGDIEIELAKDGRAPGGDAWADLDPAKTAPMIKHLLDHRTALHPELIAGGGRFATSAAVIRDDILHVYDDPAVRSYMPQARVDALMAKVTLPAETMTPAQIENARLGYRNHVKFLKQFVDAGGKMVAASDCPQGPPGLGIHEEMLMFREDVGLTPMQTIQAATKWTADAFGANDVGSIEVGKIADLDILDGDPLADIRNTRKLSAVIFDGRPIDRTYHAWYRSPFAPSSTNNGNPVIPDVAWAAALKMATVGGGRGGAGGFGGGNANPAAVQNPGQSPTPGVEALMPYEIMQGSGATTVTLRGFNFVRRSVVYVGDTAVPTKVVSRTEIQATLDPNLLAKAGRFAVTVRNPAPLATPEWGEKSNAAWLLVPFTFSIAYSKNTL